MSFKNTFKSALDEMHILNSVIKVKRLYLSTVLMFNEFFYRLRNPFHKIDFKNNSAAFNSAFNDLEREGIATIPEFFNGKELEHLKEIFNNTITQIENSPVAPDQLTPDGGKLHPRTPYKEYFQDKRILISYSNDPFKYAKEFLELAVHESILNVISKYIGKKFMLQQAIAARYYPFKENNFGSWQWHHDSWGRKINVMILLSDVGANDQHMSFMKMSHKLFHSYEKTVLNDRFSDDEVSKIDGLSKYDCLGKAGTVFIFDANGIHRGNRSLGLERDSLIFQYTAGRYLWGFDIPAKFLQNLSDNQIKLLNNNPNINYI